MRKRYSILIICLMTFFLLASTNVQTLASSVVNVTAISLNKTSEVLAVGKTDTLIASIEPSNATNQAVKWTTSNSDIANVFNGVVMAISKGTAVITATTEDGYRSASCVVIVASPVTTVSLDKTSDTLTVGGTDTLTATVNEIVGSQTTQVSDEVVNWSSSDTNVVQVGNGQIFAVGKGTAVVTATTDDGSNTASCYITVNDKEYDKTIILSKTIDFLTIGGTDTLTAVVLSAGETNTTVTWSSSDPNIVNVVGGVLVAVNTGTATITASTADGSKTATCKVTVNDPGVIVTPVSSISLNKTSDALIVGGNDILTVAISPANATNKDITWTSSNPNVVNVVNGVLTGVSTGTATITATTAYGNLSQTCQVTVNNTASSGINNIRAGGADRYGTSAAISKLGWEGTSSYAVLTSGNDYPDALSAAPLAKKYNAPILLTDRESIPQDVLTEINRLKITHMFVIGGTGVVSQAIENELNNLGITTERLGGQDRFETSIKIAEKMGVSSGEIVVTNGYEWSDALSISPIAAKKGIPIILTDKDSIPASVSNFIDKNNFTKTYILGEADLINDTIANKFPGEERITGSNEYQRNINIIKRFQNDLDINSICIASGENFPDAISGSAFAASKSSAIVLVDDKNLQDITTQFINENLSQIKSVWIFGLQGAVNDTVVQQLFK